MKKTCCRSFFLLFVIPFFNCTYLYSQTTEAGPVIKDFGKVYAIENPDFKIDASSDFKVVFDVERSPKGHDKTNALVETAARFLNMHAQNGLPMERLKVALVLHGRAVKDVLDNAAYTKKYGTDNPNKKLNTALLEAGVQIILCGQSATHQGVSRDQLIPGVQLSLSAMTALVQLQNQNYRLIKF